MIPRRYINQWREKAPWPMDSQVEQDLVICRALVQIYSDSRLSSSLAFRGGTALGKFYLNPQLRYSEDIDLVQVKPGPIKPVIDALREALSFLGEPRIRQKVHNNTLRFSFDSEVPPVVSLKLKVEINCREHFSVLGYRVYPFSVDNGWFSGRADILTYSLDEMMGTKLRALYQRKKGRDLFDLSAALQNPGLDPAVVLKCYREYMNFSTGNIPTSREYRLNLEEKRNDPEFLSDMTSLLRPGVIFDTHQAFDLVVKTLIEKM